ncbi:class I SAM-dependent methyltransferase [Nocardioides sp. JQ2195]|uniref:class I SAM-dependent methyltransferase n=1 Tax=Nocardioides sp. JQ2195 TaxID=2592334 RepID=UPI00143E2426|nr:class I SAM-dependent methyltransferase [Nocardioides sp. JQ2195]QIX26388.1 class I SAM-dependent methyltransferase [Nocardioides sp. JQ2195]
MDDIDRFNEDAATWDDDPDHVERARSVAGLVRQTIALGEDTHALEIGGGTGLLARALVDDLGTVVVTDVAPGMVEAARGALDDPAYAGWEARVYDIEHDPLPDERFDLVLGQLALHHMGDVATVVRRCAELLRPEGWVALVDLDHDPRGDFHASVHDFHGHDGFDRGSVLQWLEEAGLTDVAVIDAGTVTKEVGSSEQEFPLFLAIGRLPAT